MSTLPRIAVVTVVPESDDEVAGKSESFSETPVIGEMSGSRLAERR